jgi:uncharacterized protein DUF5663
MIKLDDNLLQELGLGALPPEEKKKMLAHIYETLEMRVGMELAKQMTDAQLNEFEEFINRNDEAGALRWLETNFPNYKDVVAAEFDKLKAEVKQVAPHILASSQQQQAAALQNPATPSPGSDITGAGYQPQQQGQYTPPQPAPQGPAAPTPTTDQQAQAYSPAPHPQYPATPPQSPPHDNGQGTSRGDYDLAA